MARSSISRAGLFDYMTLDGKVRRELTRVRAREALERDILFGMELLRDITTREIDGVRPSTARR